MEEAIFTLIGVGLGGSISILKDLLAEDRRARSDREHSRLQQLADARVAALVVADELDTIGMNFKQLARLGRNIARPIGDSPFLATDAWRSHKTNLARVVHKLDVWKSLVNLYHNADSLRQRLIIDGPNAPIPADRVQTLHDDALRATELAETLYRAVVEIDIEIRAIEERPGVVARALRLRRGKQRELDGGTASS